MPRKKNVDEIIEENEEEIDENQESEDEEFEDEEEFDEDEVEYGYEEYGDDFYEDNQNPEDENFEITNIKEGLNIQKIAEENKKEIRVDNNSRISLPKLTKYEKCKIISTRVEQLTKGSKPTIKNTQHKSYMEIAIDEVESKTLFFELKRLMPGNKYEMWKLEELDTTFSEDEKIKFYSINV